jgi:hypothetical protein
LISGDWKTEGGGQQPATPQLALKLRRQSVGTPAATQLGNQGQGTAKEEQAHKPAQAKFQHGLAIAAEEV